MIIELPLPNCGHSVAPRHIVIPFQCGGPSSGNRNERTVEWMPSAPTRMSPRVEATTLPCSCEVGANSIRVLFEADESMTRQHRRGAESLAYCLQQQCLQLAADLRHRESGVQPAASAHDLRPEPMCVAEILRANPDLVEAIEQRELSQFLHGKRQQIDADTQLADRVAAFVHRAIDALPMQSQGCDESANAGADDDHTHESTSRVQGRWIYAAAGPR